MVLLTKIDQHCPEIHSDLENVYKLKSVKQKVLLKTSNNFLLEKKQTVEPFTINNWDLVCLVQMKQFEADVGIPMNCIFPVKNYHEEIDLDSKVDSLILSAVRHIIDAGGDYCRRQAEQQTT